MRMHVLDINQVLMLVVYGSYALPNEMNIIYVYWQTKLWH